MMKLSLKSFQEKLLQNSNQDWPEDVWDTEAFREGKTTLSLVVPKGKDFQTAHDQNEFYFIMKGSGILVKNEYRYAFSSGDVLFVAAHTDHHFEQVSDDLMAWALKT